jgi:AcrR family transcriptional regulator
MATARNNEGAKRKDAGRRTQAERSVATQRLLIDATLRCLQKYGYAACSVSRIIKEAGVSRGALIHHYPSKNELILEAAKSLMERVYDRLDAMIVETESDARQPTELVEEIWREFFASSVHDIYLELLVASRRDEELVELLRSLGTPLASRMSAIFDHHFESRTGSVGSVMEMFMFTRWILRGMAIDANAFGDAEGEAIKHFLHLWTSVLATQVNALNEPRPKKGDPKQ